MEGFKLSDWLRATALLVAVALALLVGLPLACTAPAGAQMAQTGGGKLPAVGGGGGLAGTNLTSGSGATSPQTTASISIDNNAVAYALIGAASDGAEVTSITVSNNTLANVTWSEVASIVFGTRRRLSVWRGVNTSGSTQSGTVDVSGTVAGGTLQELMWIVDKWTGIDTTTPNGTSASNTVTGGTSVAVTVVGTPDAGDYVIGGFAHTGASADMTINSELSTELLELGSGTDVRRILSAYDSTPDASPVPGVSWTGAEDAAGIAFIINVAP